MVPNAPSTSRSSPNGLIYLLEKPVLSLYSTSTPAEELDSVFHLLYRSDAAFEDPLLIVYGKANIRSQFLSLRQMLASARVIRHDAFSDGEKVVLQIDIEYKLFRWSWSRFVVHQYTTLELDVLGQIKRHTDSWSIAEIVKSLPLLSLGYDITRSVAGSLTSFAFSFIQAPLGSAALSAPTASSDYYSR